MSTPSSSGSSSWSKFFKQPNHHKSSNPNSPSLSYNNNPYSDNPFHRPPSSTGTYTTSSAASAAASEATFRTGHSSTSTASNNTVTPTNHHHHPYPHHHLHQQQPTPKSSTSFHNSSPPMSSHDLDADEAECPVCLESLSFSFRLPGEKPHVVPECGHALHEACFSAVYGPVPSRNPAGGIIPRKSSLGVCGVCRRPMKVSDGDSGKSNKLAALTGMGERSTPSPYSSHPHTPQPGGMPSKHGPSGVMRSQSGGGNGLGGGAMRGRNDLPGAYDPMDDDPIEKDHHHHHGSHHGHGGGSGSVYSSSSGSGVGVVAPSIIVRSEFATINRGMQPVQPLTCIVVVELPSRRGGGGGGGGGQGMMMEPDVYRSINPVGGGTPDEGVYGQYQQQQQQQHSQHLQHGGGGGGGGQPGHLSRKASSIESGAYSNHRDGDYASPTQQQQQQREYQQHHQRDPYAAPSTYSGNNPNTYSMSPSTISAMTGTTGTGGGGYTSGISQTSSNGAESTAFNSITEDLRQRVADWKGHPMAGLGPLQMFDILSVRRDVLVREFYVYLFKEAVICVLEEKKKSLGRLLSPTGSADSGSVNGSTFSGGVGSGGSGSNGGGGGGKGVLRLKGRIYIRHIKQVHDTSSAGELSLTIDMEDERLESFILIFRDRSTLENWRANISQLVAAFQQGNNVGVGGGSLAGSGRTAEGGMGPGGELSDTVRGSTGGIGGGGGGNGSRHGHGGADMDEFGASPLSLTARDGNMSSISNNLPKGISGKAARMLSGSTSNSDGGSSTSLSQIDLLGVRNNPAAAAGGSGSATNGYGASKLGKIPSEEQLSYTTNAMANMNMNMAYGVGPGPDSRAVPPHVSSSASNSLQPLQHPPLDLILVISVPPAPGSPIANNAVTAALSPSPATAQLKVRVIRNTLDFVLGQLGPRDRLSLVTFEVGPGGRVRKTPFLSVGSGNGGGRGKDGLGRRRLQAFVDGILGPEEDPVGGGGGGGKRALEEDEFLVRNANEEKTDVVTAVNHGLDVVLQRKQKNSVSGMVLVSDAADSTRRAQMDLVLARAEAANVPIHSFGYGRSHDPASLWLISNHTSGTYTFVKDWYDLRDCLAGCLGGMMSIGLLNMKLHMKIVDANRFRIRKVSGGPTSIVAQDGKDVHVEVGELRYGERKEMLIELELDNNLDIMRLNNLANGTGSPGGHESMQGRNGAVMNATDAFVARMGLDISGDSPNLMDGVMDRMIDEVPVFEVDGSFFDPTATKQVSRLAHPVLLTVTLMPVSPRSPPTPSQQPTSDAMIVRRRMELLASDMVTRALVLVSRKNYVQAQRILAETTRILHTVLQSISQSLPPPSSSRAGGIGGARNRKEVLILSAVRALQAMLQDLQVLTDALDENVDMFAHDQRNFGAQQAMILRDQKSWSKRSAVERLFWTVDNSIELVGRSVDWVGRE